MASIRAAKFRLSRRPGQTNGTARSLSIFATMPSTHRTILTRVRLLPSRETSSAVRWAGQFRRTRLLCSRTMKDSARICTRRAWRLFPMPTRNGTFVPLGSGCGPAGSSARAACASEVTSLLNLWPIANGPDNLPAGTAQYISSPLQTIREDFGTARVDHIFSEKDSAIAAYPNDDSGSVTATPLDAFSTDLISLREQVFSLEETHVLSTNVVNTARVGFSRAGYFFTGEPTPGSPAATVPGFLVGLPVGAVVVGGSQASNPQAQLGLAGSNNGSNLHIARNLFTYSDQVSVTKGRNQWTLGVWFQRFQSNELIALSQFGQMTFTGLPAFLAGTVSFLYDPAPTPLSWRSLY